MGLVGCARAGASREDTRDALSAHAPAPLRDLATATRLGEESGSKFPHSICGSNAQGFWAAYERVAAFVKAEEAVGILCDSDADADADFPGGFRRGA